MCILPSLWSLSVLHHHSSSPIHRNHRGHINQKTINSPSIHSSYKMGMYPYSNTVDRITADKQPGRFEITHSGPIPAGVNKEKAVAVLHDHDGYFRAAEHYKEHKQLPSDSSKNHKVPSEIQARTVASAAADVKVYTVRNDVPNPVFDSKVNTEYEVVDLADGIWYRASSAMGVVYEGLWTVEEGSGGWSCA